MIVVVKQKTAYEMRSSEWSSDGCSSDLFRHRCTERGEFAAMGGRFLRHLGVLLSVLLELAGDFTSDAAGVSVRVVAADLAVRLMQETVVADRTSVVEGKSVSLRLDLGGSRVFKTHIPLNPAKITL